MLFLHFESNQHYSFIRLGGSGGGWQDSGGVYAGFKEMQGVENALLPRVTPFQPSAETLELLTTGLVALHAGLSSNCGPILEEVTEKYLLQVDVAPRARAARVYDQVMAQLGGKLNLSALGSILTSNFEDNICEIIPQATNAYTKALIEAVKTEIEGYLGFVMFGGLSGGGCGFLFEPSSRALAVGKLKVIMHRLKVKMQASIPFAVEPVVYSWAVNEVGTVSSFVETMPIEQQSSGTTSAIVASPVDTLLVDAEYQATMERMLRDGAIGLIQNRINQKVENVSERLCELGSGLETVRNDDCSVGLVILAGGLGTRWTRGSGCVKAVSMPVEIDGRWPSFLEIQCAKLPLGPIVIMTSHLTHAAVSEWAAGRDHISVVCGTRVGRRIVPTTQLLKEYFAQHPIVAYDDQKLRAAEQERAGLLNWALEAGEGTSYYDQSEPNQALHPPGHLFEMVSLLRSKTLASEAWSKVTTLVWSNCDTLGLSIDREILAWHRESVSWLSFEVCEKLFEDRGGSLAVVDGKRRIVEGLAMPSEAVELGLSYYSTGTCWMQLSGLKDLFKLDSFDNAEQIEAGVNYVQAQLPAYVTLKEAKRRRNGGQVDILPLAQVEKLWGDVTGIIEATNFVCVPHERGAQLKDVAHLEMWREECLPRVNALLASSFSSPLQ